MHYSDNETVGLLRHHEDDDATVNEFTAEKRSNSDAERSIGPCGMLECCDCGSLSCQARDLQLPASFNIIYECWTIIYQRPRWETQSWLSCLGCKLWNSITLEPGKVVAAVPQTYFEQEDLAAVVDRAKSRYEPLTFVSRDYDGDLERRLRKLDWKVQDELYALIKDRTDHASNSFRRREYKLAVLLEVPGGEMTDAGSSYSQSPLPGAKTWMESLSSSSPSASLSPWLNWGSGMRRRRDRKASSHVEYRVVLRGCEVKINDAGWGVYDRYAQPWKLADEAELASVREKSDGYQALLG